MHLLPTPFPSAWRSTLRGLALGLSVVLAMALAGCATPRSPPSPAGQPHWVGRLTLKVENDPRLSFSAGFDLRGSAREGALELATPLGNTAALLDWSAAGARLQVPGEPPRRAASLEALVRAATGTDIPIAVLFDWLAGQPTVAPGWQVDLSQRAEGRLQARRQQPPAELRLVLDNR